MRQEISAAELIVSKLDSMKRTTAEKKAAEKKHKEWLAHEALEMRMEKDRQIKEQVRSTAVSFSFLRRVNEIQILESLSRQILSNCDSCEQYSFDSLDTAENGPLRVTPYVSTRLAVQKRGLADSVITCNR